MRSMTGFGRGSASEGPTSVVVELKSVNHKGLDVRARLPRELLSAELDAQKAIKARFRRGRFDLSAHLSHDATALVPRLNEAAMDALLEDLRAFAARQGLTPPTSVADLLRAPGVISQPSPDDDEHDPSALFQAALRAAIDDLADARDAEGTELEKILDGHAAELAGLVDEVAARSHDAPARLKAQLEARVAELEVELDPARLVQEVALLADKADVREEIDRLRAHLTHFAQLKAGEGAVGRKLDFLCQELNREANTVGSKCADADAAHLVVELKSCIERLREQVQNVE